MFPLIKSGAELCLELSSHASNLHRAKILFPETKAKHKAGAGLLHCTALLYCYCNVHYYACCTRPHLHLCLVLPPPHHSRPAPGFISAGFTFIGSVVNPGSVVTTDCREEACRRPVRLADQLLLQDPGSHRLDGPGGRHGHVDREQLRPAAGLQPRQGGGSWSETPPPWQVRTEGRT